MKIEMRKLTEIRPYDNNPRLHDDGVDAVATSIHEFGFRQPIVVDSGGLIEHFRRKKWVGNEGLYAANMQ